MKIITAILLVALWAAGCATHGRKFDMAEVEAMKPGTTTKEEATTKLGKPKTISILPDGTTVLQWIFIESGSFGATNSHATVVFDKDGKLVRVAHRSGQ